MQLVVQLVLVIPELRKIPWDPRSFHIPEQWSPMTTRTGGRGPASRCSWARCTTGPGSQKIPVAVGWVLKIIS